MRAFRVLREGEVAVSPPKKLRRWPVVAVAVMVLVALLAGGVWWSGMLNDAAESDPVLALPKGPKIAVLPFDNLSGDPDQDYFVDGLTENLTTRLTRLGYLFVVARNSAFKYKGKSPDVREVGNDLGVDYIIEGSVRRSEDRIRVNAQLLNAKDGTHVWAQTFDKKLDAKELFTLQDELTIGVTEAVGGTTGPLVKQLLEKIEATPPDDLASFECVLLTDRYYNTFDRAVRARDCLEAAVSREPDYAMGWAALAQIYHSEHFLGANPRPDPLGRSMQAVDRALKLKPDLARAVSQHARLSFSLRLKEDALSSLERSLRLEPNLPGRLFSAADQMMRLGDWERGAALWNKAIALSPTPSAWVYWAPIHYHHWKDEPEKAYEFILLLKERLANWYWTIPFEAVLLVEMGRVDEAREVLAGALKTTPSFPSIARSDLEKYWWPQPEYIDRSMAALYKAGLPKVAEASK